MEAGLCVGGEEDGHAGLKGAWCLGPLEETGMGGLRVCLSRMEILKSFHLN